MRLFKQLDTVLNVTLLTQSRDGAHWFRLVLMPRDGRSTDSMSESSRTLEPEPRSTPNLDEQYSARMARSP